jgi:hypothetical protein
MSPGGIIELIEKLLVRGEYHSLPRLGQAARPGMAPTGEFFPDRASMAGKVAVF